MSTKAGVDIIHQWRIPVYQSSLDSLANPHLRLLFCRARVGFDGGKSADSLLLLPFFPARLPTHPLPLRASLPRPTRSMTASSSHLTSPLPSFPPFSLLFAPPSLPRSPIFTPSLFTFSPSLPSSPSFLPPISPPLFLFPSFYANSPPSPFPPPPHYPPSLLPSPPLSFYFHSHLPFPSALCYLLPPSPHPNFPPSSSPLALFFPPFRLFLSCSLYRRP